MSSPSLDKTECVSERPPEECSAVHASASPDHPADRVLKTKSRKATLDFSSIPLRLLIKLSLRAAKDFQSLCNLSICAKRAAY